MTHNVHPYAHRLGILRDWQSRWFGTGEQYRSFLKSDVLIREFLEKRLRAMYVATVEMERSEKQLRIVIATSRPGMIIGRNGEGAVKLKDDLNRFIRRKKLIGAKEIKVDVEEIRSPESNAAIVAMMVVEGIEKRMPYRRVLKQTAEKVMANRDVKGVKVRVAGRLGGADMARSEAIKQGRIPLQTLRADVDYALREAHTPQGVIGVKVWIYKGEIFD